MSSIAEIKQPAEWALDHALELLEPIPVSVAEPIHIARAARGLHMLLMVAVIRPDVLNANKKAKEKAKDFMLGIESGQLPKPDWWDSAKHHVLVRDAAPDPTTEAGEKA